MIRIVKSISVKSLDGGSDGKWHLLSLVAASGSVNSSVNDDAGESVRTVKLLATITQMSDLAAGNVSVKIVYDDDTSESFGDTDLPVRLETEDANGHLRLSSTYKTLL